MGAIGISKNSGWGSLEDNSGCRWLAYLPVNWHQGVVFSRELYPVSQYARATLGINQQLELIPGRKYPISPSNSEPNRKVEQKSRPSPKLEPEFRKSFRVAPTELERQAPPVNHDERLPPLNLLIGDQHVRPDERHIKHDRRADRKNPV